MEINWDNVFSNIPEIMGLDFILHGRKWYGKFRIDGSPHSRRDKLVVQMGAKDRQPVIIEQGGEVMSLWTWLKIYGGLTNSEIFKRLSGVEYKKLVFSEEEYVGEVRYVAPWQFISQGGTACDWHCPLFVFLSGIYCEDKVREAFKRYNVSTGLKHPRTNITGTRFWYVDRNGNICYDKTMFYQDNGHRDKSCPPMRMYKQKWGYTANCFFGEDSINNGKPVFVVESEKTAIVACIEYPDFNWVASGGKNNLKNVGRLGNNVYLVPDIDAISEWEKLGRIWNWWDRCGMCVGEKWDIGDFLLERRLLDVGRAAPP